MPKKPELHIPQRYRLPNNLTIKDFRQGAHHLAYCSLENVRVGKESSSSSSLIPPEFSPSKDFPTKKLSSYLDIQAIHFQIHHNHENQLRNLSPPLAATYT